jgi:hypothetical protein
MEHHRCRQGRRGTIVAATVPAKLATSCALALLLLTVEAGAKTWIVPGTFQGPGANGIQFSSALTLVNPDAEPRFVSLIPIGPPGSPIFDPLGVSLAAGESKTMPAPAPVSGGALVVQADGGVVAFARLDAGPEAVIEGSPVFGSALPVIEASAVIPSGGSGHASWVTQGAGSRTNVAVVFTDGGGGAATVRLFDQSGTLLGSVDYDVARLAFLQQSLTAWTTAAIQHGRISIQVTRGHALGYVGVADSDVAIVPLMPLPSPPNAGQRLALVSTAVAQVPGKEGVSWHTDAELTNPGTDNVDVNTYLLRGDGTVSVGDPISVPAGTTMAIPELVQSLFSVSTPIAGAVLWGASGPLIIGTQTRAQGPFVSSGEISLALPLADLATPADGPLWIGGVGSSSSRTNLIVVAGAVGAFAAVDLFDGSGSQLETILVKLPPFGFGEFPLEEFLPQGFSGAFRVTVRVQGGSANVHATSVDASSGDPVSFEASPRPVRIPASAPPIPTGDWGGADDVNDHLKVDALTVTLFRKCQSGTFPQPDSLDAQGGFSVFGRYGVSAGPSITFDAILSGYTDGHTAFVSITALDPIGVSLVDSNPETFVLGAPFQDYQGPCPVEE